MFNNAFYGKTMESVRKRIKVEFIEKHDEEKSTEQQSNLPSNGFHKSYTIYDSYTFKENEALMDKPIYLGFAILELSKSLLWETYYVKLQPYFSRESLQLHYIDTDSFVLNVIRKDIIRDLKNLEDFSDFSKLNENYDLFSNRNKKIMAILRQKLRRVFVLMNLIV